MTKKAYKMKKMFSLFGILLSGLLIPNIAVYANTAPSYEDYKTQLSYTKDNIDYYDYLDIFDDLPRPDASINISPVDFSRHDGMKPEVLYDYKGRQGQSLYTEEKGFIEYDFFVEKEGLYEMQIEYFPVEGKSASIQRSILIDGKLPYEELALVEFSRLWVNSIGEWQRDNQGNDLKPTQIEKPDWIIQKLYDSQGYISNPLQIYLSKGEHVLTILSIREPMVIGKVSFSNSDDLKTYEQLISEQEGQGYIDSNSECITIQAENASRKSSQMLYPTQDQSSPAIYPYDSKELRNNTIGGGNWKHVGQWIEYDFDVKETGYYNISFHAKQNFVKGAYVSRKIYIDGVIPFKELEQYPFHYNSKWKRYTLQSTEGENYRIYLEKGKHTLRMEVVLGDFAKIVGEVQDILLSLNEQYRKIIQITGVAPDEFRDYQLEKSFPELESELTGIRNQLEQVINDLRPISGKGSARETILITMRDQINTIIKDVETTTKVLKDFKINMSALGTWIIEAVEQPLQLDAIYISKPNESLPKVNDTFFDYLIHEIKRMFWSFVIDYNTIGNVAEDTKESVTITVWVGTGRDQANVIKSLIDEKFTLHSGINVNLMLVDMGTLLQATLAGEGPDVAIQVASAGAMASIGTTMNSNDLPVNYGLRNAVVDLTTITSQEELMEVKGRFRESALEAYQYDTGLYALPETQTFPMMFYRKDILKELVIEIPKTWDEMKIAMSALNENQMELGMLPSELLWTSILYQHDGELYTGDGTASALDTENAISAFKEYCEYYMEYKLDRETSVEQRFRVGESPIIIADYTTYNNFQVSAPDIKGMWGFAPIPGVMQSDGTIQHIAASTGLSCMMMNKAENKTAAWEFMKWWTSAEIQTDYGREMEGLMGAAARYPSANIEAFDSLPWPVDDYEALKEQFDQVKGIKQVPGGYYSWRNVNNAFYKVMTLTGVEAILPREALAENIRYINEEITYKRSEFGMSIAE